MIRYATSIALILALFACSANDAVVATPTDAAANQPAPDGGDAGVALRTFEDLPDCDRTQPSLRCIRALFTPLRGTTAWPFDAKRVGGALGQNELAVAKGWDLTAHHVLEANLTVGTYECFFGAFRYATDGVAFTGPGCGRMLVAGGHAHALACKAGSVAMANCVDEVSYDQSFDLVVARGPERSAWLELAPDLPKVGDPVFLVGNPAFAWLSDEERKTLVDGYPFVTYGKVVRADGRGIVTSAAAFAGSSGGPLLDAHGKVLGVVSTLVAHQRARGTAIPADLADYYSVAAAPDAEARRVVTAAQKE